MSDYDHQIKHAQQQQIESLQSTLKQYREALEKVDNFFNTHHIKLDYEVAVAVKQALSEDET